MPPTDPATGALIAYLQLGVAGATIVLLVLGKFRHEREVKREELATAEANARTAKSDAQRDAALAIVTTQSATIHELATAVDAIKGLLDRLVPRGRS